MGILVVYDVTDEQSFQNIKNWMNNIQQHATENVDVILVGHRCHDVENKVVETERGRELAEEYGRQFIEVSSRNNINVDEVFMMMTKLIYERLVHPVPIGKSIKKAV
mmetsp:Transcript_23097/g.35976  ORF Transcript_23097/g.35976 Transcript_23097/m.35976 type:complete len:107 (+) Transcript_23097:387-707(+)